METFSCNLCKFKNYPDCVFYNIINSISLEDMLNNDHLPKKSYLVCKNNSQIIKNGKLIINESCNNCNLCKFVCTYKADQYKVDENFLINDIHRLNIFLDVILEKCIVGTEIKANGNFRNKRLDIVIKHKNNIILIKVLTSIDKYGFYMRSYKQVANEYKELYPEYHFSFKCLVDSSFYNKYNNSDFEKIVTINKLIEELKGV